VANNILIEGAPGVGKTTLIESVLAGFGGRAAGFTTGEIRIEGRRLGFRIQSLEGEEGVLAHMDFPSRPRVGKYGVNLDDLQRIGVAAIECGLDNTDLIVVDEIGKMELFSDNFREAVLRCLDSPVRLLATVQLGSNRFTDGIKSRDDVNLIKVTRENRDALPEQLLELIGGK
jgi:nucleoside-triphosphatase